MTAPIVRGDHQDCASGDAMRVLMLGRPGAGKGTQASRLAEMLDVLHVSTGDLVRDAIARNGPVGRRCDAYVTAGHLVPTLLMGNVVRDVFRTTDAIDRGFVLDGFPRTSDQLQILDELLEEHELDAALELEVSPELVLRRLAARGRHDDEQDVLLRRLELFEEHTRPMIESLRQRGLLISIDGSRREDEVSADLRASLERMTSIRSAEPALGASPRRIL
jgi:adenylate kinase